MTPKEVIQKVQQDLFTMQDLKYRDFHAKLMPTVEKESVIGVRVPVLRTYAKKFGKTEEAKQFLKILPHQYYEENNLHAFLIEKIRDFDQALAALEAFLPYIDNWATCDMMRIPVFKKHLPELYSKIPDWLGSDNPYAVRFGIKMLMDFFLGENFKAECAERVCAVTREEYYVKMMIAWYFATALAKNYNEIIPYIESRRLEKQTHNKTIQKAIESYRITDEQKSYLRTLKVK